MNRVLVDTAAWIDYFNRGKYAEAIEEMIDDNTVCTNDLILTELLPSIKIQKQFHLAELLQAIEKVDLHIDWNDLVNMQISNAKHGINKVGLPDLIIAQNVIRHQLVLFSPDRHFELMKGIFGFRMYT